MTVFIRLIRHEPARSTLGLIYRSCPAFKPENDRAWRLFLLPVIARAYPGWELHDYNFTGLEAIDN